MKWWLSAFTLAGMVTAGLLAPEKQPEALAAPAADVSVSVLPDAPQTTQVAMAPTPSISMFRITGTSSRERYRSPISDQEAIKIALERGEALRSERAPSARGTAPSREVAVEATPTPEAVKVADPIWRVTTDRVNLRSGPGTDNAVISKADFGDALTPVSGIGTEWVEVSLPSGDTAWIFAEFLAPTEG